MFFNRYLFGYDMEFSHDDTKRSREMEQEWQNRRTFSSASALGGPGLAMSAQTGPASDGSGDGSGGAKDSPFAVEEHDRSGTYGTSANLEVK